MPYGTSPEAAPASTVTENRMPNRKIRTLAVTGITIVAAALIALGTTAASATTAPRLAASHAAVGQAGGPEPQVRLVPDSGSSCGGGFDQDSTCVWVYGSGLHIDSVQIAFTQSVLDPHFWTAHIEIVGPKGFIKNCADFSTIPGYNDNEFNHVIGCTWAPNHNEPAGNYCGITWAKQSRTNYRNLDEACLDVHP
jgi:hypothetical protein